MSSRPTGKTRDPYPATKDAGVWDLAVTALIGRLTAELTLAGAVMALPAEASRVATDARVERVDFSQPDLELIFCAGAVVGFGDGDQMEAIAYARHGLRSAGLWDPKARHFERGSTWSDESLCGLATWFKVTESRPDTAGFVRDQLPHVCRQLKSLRYRMDQAEAMFRSATAMLAGDRTGTAHVNPPQRARALVAASRLSRVPVEQIARGMAQRSIRRSA